MRVMSPLEERRRRLGKTQTDVAREVGVDRSVVARWEDGLVSPTARYLSAYAKSLEIGADELLRSVEAARQQAIQEDKDTAAV